MAWLRRSAWISAIGSPVSRSISFTSRASAGLSSTSRISIGATAVDMLKSPERRKA